MAQFASFSNVLPDPNYEIGLGGQLDSNYRDGIGVNAVKLTSVYPMMKSTYNSNRGDRADAYHHRWDIDLAYNPMTCEQFHPILTFLLEKQTTLEPFYVSLPQNYGQITSDIGLYNSYQRGAEMLLLESDGAQVGELFSVIGKSKVYMITRVETPTNYLTPLGAPGAGQERIHITPSLQEDVTNGDILTFEKPLVKVKQQGEILSYDLGKNNLFQFSLKLEEVRT